MNPDDEIDIDETDETLGEDSVDLSEFGLDDAPDGAKDGEPDPKTEVVKQKARADALEAENVRILASQREALQTQPAPQVRREEPAPFQPRKMRELVGDDFDQQFVNNPKEALASVFDKFDDEINRRSAASSSSPAAAIVDNMIDTFTRDIRENDPEEYALAIKRFKEQVALTPLAVKAQYAQNPEALRNAMGTLWDAEVTRASRENRKAAKSEAVQRRGASPPPALGRGNPSGGSSGSGAGGTRQAVFTAVEQRMIEGGKAAGLSAKDIKEMIQEHRGEQRSLRGA